MPLSIHVAMAWLPSRRPFRRAFTRGPRLVRREHYEPPISSYGLRTSRRQPARKTVSAVPFAWTLRWPHVHLYRRVDYVAGLRRCPANPAACFAGAGANRHYSCTAFDRTRGGQQNFPDPAVQGNGGNRDRTMIKCLSSVLKQKPFWPFLASYSLSGFGPVTLGEVGSCSRYKECFPNRRAII